MAACDEDLGEFSCQHELKRTGDAHRGAEPRRGDLEDQ